MSEPLVIRPELNIPQAQFLEMNRKFSAFVAGYGCVREDTQILTTKGFRPISEVSFGDDVVSWNEQRQQFQTAPTSGGFPKGKANLYRVTTTQGEFVSSGHHRICVGRNIYRRVDTLAVGQEVFAFSEIQDRTIVESDRVWSREDDLDYWEKLADSLESCSDVSRQYGQPLLLAVKNGLSAFPLQGDVHTYAQCSFWGAYAQKGVPLEQTQGHSRQDQLICRQQTKGLPRLRARLAQALAGRIPVESPEQIWGSSLELAQKFALTSFAHLQAALFALCGPKIQAFLSSTRAMERQNLSFWADMEAQGFSIVNQCSPSPVQLPVQGLQSSLCHQLEPSALFAFQSFDSKPFLTPSLCVRNASTNTIIINIEKIKSKDWYWDIHVGGNNNYISKDGILHHNSGKTFVGSAGLARHFWQHPRINTGYFAPTYPQIRDIFYPTVEECFFQWGLRVQIKSANNEVHVFSGRTQRGVIMCRSMERPETIIGFKIGHALADEIDVMPMDKAQLAWRKIIARMRYNVPGLRNGIDVTTTPEGFKFVYHQFVKAVRDKPELAKLYGIVRASTYDNAANLPEDYIPSLLQSYPAQLIDAYINGEFVNLQSGTIYVAFSRQFNSCDDEIMEGEPLFIGMDFNVGKMAAVAHVLRDGQPRAVDELTGGYDTPDMVRRIKERYWRHDGNNFVKTREIRIYPDASGDSRKSVNASQTDIALLREAGFVVCVNAANPPVKDRINAANAMFCNANGERRYKINVAKCPTYAEALEQQAWAANGEPDKTSGHDHINDAATYYIAKEFPVVKKQVRFGF